MLSKYMEWIRQYMLLQFTLKCTAYKYLNCNHLAANVKNHPEVDVT